MTLSGTASDVDPEDNLTYLWTHDSDPAIAITGSDSLSASFTAPDVAASTTITVTLTVSDGIVDVSDALQVTITDSRNINLAATGSITDTAALELSAARGIATFESGGSTYAAVASPDDDGVQIPDVTDPSVQCPIKCYKCDTGPASRRAPFGGNRRRGVPGRLGERRNGKALAVAALALVMAAGLLAAQPGGWIGAPSGDGGAAVPDMALDTINSLADEGGAPTQFYPFVVDSETWEVLAHGADPTRKRTTSLALTAADRSSYVILADLRDDHGT